eukprot:Transcript_27824.p2 GENE.Transcript_27824~~Transcript_27824.p2  ORF type:complete len:94 (-),score=0.36 Transcript_27824:20-301(-)
MPEEVRAAAKATGPASAPVCTAETHSAPQVELPPTAAGPTPIDAGPAQVPPLSVSVSIVGGCRIALAAAAVSTEARSPGAARTRHCVLISSPI